MGETILTTTTLFAPPTEPYSVLLLASSRGLKINEHEAAVLNLTVASKELLLTNKGCG